MFSKFMGFVVAVCVGIGIVGCGSGSGAPKCESGEVKKAFLERPRMKEMKEIFGNVKFSDFKTISQDKEFENIVNCQCTMTIEGQSGPISFSAERLENGKIAIHNES